MHEPSTLDPADWKLSIGGEVDQPYTLTVAELSRLETHSVVNTLECAGNGSRFPESRCGSAVAKGAVGTARFSGPRLRDLLPARGREIDRKHVMFRGLDDVPGKVLRSFAASQSKRPRIPIPWSPPHMNGGALPSIMVFRGARSSPVGSAQLRASGFTEIKVLEKELKATL